MSSLPGSSAATPSLPRPRGTVVVSLGELLVEVMRPRQDAPLDVPGSFLGPFASGAPAIFAWAAASLGAPTRFVGVCGDDPFGALCRRQLRRAGVELFVRSTPDYDTGVAFVSYARDGGRTFLFHLRHAAAAQLSPSDLTPELFAGVGWLHVTGSSLGVSESMRRAVLGALEQAKACGAVVSFDPNVRPELLHTTLKKLCGPVLDVADVVLPSGPEAELLTGLGDPESACRALLADARIVLLKRGAEGCTLFADGVEQDFPGVAVHELDPTGAGDCFAAGFAVASLRGLGPADAARFANVVGARSTTAFGPTTATLSFDKVAAPADPSRRVTKGLPMPTKRITKRKLENLQVCAQPSGVIAALAMDQRASLRKALEGVDGGSFSDEQLGEFKSVVTRTLTPHASAILLDPQYGLGASRARADGSGLLLAYEQSGYDNTKPGRLPDLAPGWSVQRLAEAGATGVKLLVYYNPFEDESVNEIKHAFVERVGAECEAVGLPLFLEPVTYDADLPDAAQFAAKQPAYVCETVAEFSKDRYAVDVLKVEMPVSGKYVDGLSTPPKEALFTRDEAVKHLQEAGSLAQRPFIYLSAGVDMNVFAEMLTLAGENGVPYSGVLCGRATWKGGIPVYAQKGADEMAAYLQKQGVANIKMLNGVVEKHAQPWHERYGGLGGLEVVD